MGKKQIIFKLTIGAAIFILALILIHFKKESDTIRTQFRPVKMIKELPKFNSIDINGHPVRSKDFRGKNIYIQFVEPFDFDDIDLIKTVYSNWKDENLKIIVITKDLEKFKVKSGINVQDIIVIANDYEEMKSKFNSPSCCGTYYLFNSSGIVVDSERNYIGYERGVKVHLKRLIKNEYFSISNFIKVNENIRNVEWFSEVAEIIEKEDKEYFIISMFTSICDACITGIIINNLKKLYSETADYVYVLCILNNKYNQEDINVLTSQLKIKFPVIIADQLLSQKWNYFIQEFREYDLSDIVFIVDKSGNILRIFDKNCNCFKSFFDFVFSLKNY